jgi:hypothetical protein
MTVSEKHHAIWIDGSGKEEEIVVLQPMRDPSAAVMKDDEIQREALA